MVEEDPSRKNFFSDIVSSVSRGKFSQIPEDPYLFSRDYISVHIWDVRNNKSPLRTLNVNDYLEKRLCEAYETEAIFDKFDMQVSSNGQFILTGSYNGNAHVIDLQNQVNCNIDVKFMDKRGKNVGANRLYRGRRLLPGGSGQSFNTGPVQKSGATDSKSSDSQSSAQSLTAADMTSKIPLCTWHP
jgi:serine/threonine-protein phosphatase 2A regulatory subunit B